MFCDLAAKAIESIDNYNTMDSAGVDTFADTMDYSVRKLFHAGIIDGKGEGIFDPEGTLTREEAAKIICRILERFDKLPAKVESPSYSDGGHISDWAKEPVAILYTTGLMKGDYGKFAPQEMLTKEQSIAIMIRLYEYIKS